MGKYVGKTSLEKMVLDKHFGEKRVGKTRFGKTIFFIFYLFLALTNLQHLATHTHKHTHKHTHTHTLHLSAKLLQVRTWHPDPNKNDTKSDGMAMCPQKIKLHEVRSEIHVTKPSLPAKDLGRCWSCATIQPFMRVFACKFLSSAGLIKRQLKSQGVRLVTVIQMGATKKIAS